MARNDEVPPGLDPILLPGERLVVAVRSHWVSVAEPVVSTALALAVAIWVDSNVTRDTQVVGTIVWWGFFAVLARMLWLVLDWHHSWFVATDKRLLMRYGIITHKVAMMPLMKVTDMSYVRSIPGQLLGYGRFVLESAGQDQALREVKWVPEPDDTYRAICAEIFHIAPPAGSAVDPDDLLADDDGFDDGDGREGRDTRDTRDARDTRDVHGTRDPLQHRLDSYSRGVPIRPRQEGDTVYESEDIKRRRRGADTGPIWPQP
ncbi:MAG: hypothetical protein JWP82_289 [Humibacillus sp.]|nr:hypothetical protein [Humibacillus sp.]